MATSVNATTLSPQDAAIERLEHAGWQFSSWISAHDPAHPGARCAVMVSHPTHYRTVYCEVQPNGEVV